MRDTPISEQAILGAAMGAAMTGLKPIAEIMFSDFFAVCFDYIANEFPKSRYMSNGQTKCPLVVRTGNGAGSRFGAQHSQSVENWCMMIPGLKVVAPSARAMSSACWRPSVRDPDPVIFLEHKSLYATKGEVPDGEIVDTLGTAKILRSGKDATICALALMVPRALQAAEKLKAEHGIDCEVVDVRSLVPLDTQTILGSVARPTGYSRSRKIRGCAAGAPRSCRSWPMNPSMTSMARRSASRRRIYRCRRPIFWKTSYCRRRIALPRRCGGVWKLATVVSGRPGDPQSDSALLSGRPERAEQSRVKDNVMYENLLANVPTDLWIGGKWRKASDGSRFDVIDPATETKIASVASASVEDAKAAIDAAEAAFEGWAGRKPRERAEILRKAFELIMRDAERFAKLITLENGKALSDSRGEVAYAAEFFRWYAEEAVRNIGADFDARRPPARALSCNTSRPASPCW